MHIRLKFVAGALISLVIFLQRILSVTLSANQNIDSNEKFIIIYNNNNKNENSI